MKTMENIVAIVLEFVKSSPHEDFSAEDVSSQVEEFFNEKKFLLCLERKIVNRKEIAKATVSFAYRKYLYKKDREHCPVDESLVEDAKHRIEEALKNLEGTERIR